MITPLLLPSEYQNFFSDDPDSNDGDFYIDFCVKKLKTNCKSKSAYGAKCKECPRHPKTDLICSGHGVCNGASDKGNWSSDFLEYLIFQTEFQWNI